MATLELKALADADDCMAWKDASDVWQWSNSYGYNQVGRRYIGGQLKAYGCSIRFPGIAIQNAVISTAYLKLKAAASNSSTTVNSKIKGEKATNPNQIVSLIDYSARVRTDYIVNFDNIGEWVTDTWYNSPEIKAILQEIIDQDGWASGNALIIFWDDHDERSSADANTYRTAQAHESGVTNEIILHIEFEGRVGFSKAYII